MRYDYPAIAKDRVAPGVIAVVMGVQDEGRLGATECQDNGPDLGRQRRELIVDDQCAVLANGKTDVASLALQHVDPLRDLDGLNPNLGKVALGAGTSAYHEGGENDKAWVGTS